MFSLCFVVELITDRTIANSKHLAPQKLEISNAMQLHCSIVSQVSCMTSSMIQNVQTCVCSTKHQTTDKSAFMLELYCTVSIYHSLLRTEFLQSSFLPSRFDSQLLITWRCPETQQRWGYSLRTKESIFLFIRMSLYWFQVSLVYIILRASSTDI